MTRKEKERAGKSVRTMKETRRRRLPVSRTRQIVLAEVSATVIDSQLYLVLLVKRQYCKAKKKKYHKKSFSKDILLHVPLEQSMRCCGIIAGLKSQSIAQAFLRKYVSHITCFRNLRNSHGYFCMSGQTRYIAQPGLLGNETEKQ